MRLSGEVLAVPSWTAFAFAFALVFPVELCSEDAG